jgi:hypothetical protein
VCWSTSSWTIWGGGHRFIVACQYNVCCSTSSWTIWGGGHRFVVGCQYTVCCSTSSWTIWVVGTGVLWDVNTLCPVVPPPGLHGVVGPSQVCDTAIEAVCGGTCLQVGRNGHASRVAPPPLRRGSGCAVRPLADNPLGTPPPSLLSGRTHRSMASGASGGIYQIWSSSTSHYFVHLLRHRPPRQRTARLEAPTAARRLKSRGLG